MAHVSDVTQEDLQLESANRAISTHTGKSRLRPRTSWHVTAFVMESVLMLLFMVFSLAVVVFMLNQAHTMGAEADELSYGIALATTQAQNGAEAFAADPTEKVPEATYYTVQDGVFTEQDDFTVDAYTVRRAVEKSASGAGTLYKARISVERYGEEVYTLTTARYVAKDRG